MHIVLKEGHAIRNTKYGRHEVGRPFEVPDDVGTEFLATGFYELPNDTNVGTSWDVDKDEDAPEPPNETTEK